MTLGTYPPHLPHPPHPSQSLLRLRLALHAGGPRAIDGAWWPRSYDLLVELPSLLAGLPRAWGHIASVMYNGAVWSPAPGRMFVAGEVVRLRRSPTAATHTVVLLAPGHGRWDLLVVPPGTTEEAAGPIMDGAAGVSRALVSSGGAKGEEELVQ
ncbi:DUF5994 family protein [Streptomyces endophyticus]|uniref:DUF5994 family protein n=1 Tax=Streptomyces endophyticus TaxID=714166 RepID=A0ABU6EYN4_9ACTN|nr:DUF5994 family protein [Streptomyces endophyticus]MEB8336864.1 DUF5994 family protein [Streptomyces endophyticus]